MNIMVCVKQVPDNAVVPKLDPSTGKVMTQGVETMVSPFDLNAIEAGLTLVSEHGGEVSVITAGDDSCKTALRIGLSMGAEKAYLVCDSALEDSDTWATSYTLAKAIASIGSFDVILCGKQAIDDDAGQVAAGIAEQLGISQVTYVNEIREVTAGSITVKRVCPAGEEVVTASLPVVLSCEKSLNEPRYPTLKRTRMANRVEIPTLDCAAIGADAGKVGKNSPSAVKRLYTPAPRQSGEILKGEADEIARTGVQKLVDQKVI
ncbi:MAG: electron transfer flavoprotein subunit beta/FixA family protein [Lawsonibacter sp.]|jgi:electron transfer flavoprotein beta subunit|nr:electron transfer flavoprotein subunit beta/FixA family protein [Lawsonibacter sp.]